MIAGRNVMQRHFSRITRKEHACEWTSSQQFPSASVPAMRATILRPVRAVAAVRRDEFDAAPREVRIELVGLARVVPNEPSGHFLHQPVGQRGLGERDFMRCGTVNVNSDGRP
jgi:hypothetical protein